MGKKKTVTVYSCGCGHEWQHKPKAGEGVACPKCGSSDTLASREEKAGNDDEGA